MSRRDIFAMVPVPKRICLPELEPDMPPVESSLLVASRGQLSEGSLFGSVELGRNTPPGSIISEDIVRVIPKPGHLEVVYAVLTSVLGRAMLRTTACGTSISGMLPNLAAALPFPKLSVADANRIRHHV